MPNYDRDQVGYDILSILEKHIIAIGINLYKGSNLRTHFPRLNDDELREELEYLKYMGDIVPRSYLATSDNLDHSFEMTELGKRVLIGSRSKGLISLDHSTASSTTNIDVRGATIQGSYLGSGNATFDQRTQIINLSNQEMHKIVGELKTLEGQLPEDENDDLSGEIQKASKAARNNSHERFFAVLNNITSLIRNAALTGTASVEFLDKARPIFAKIGLHI